jgi:digeranylgeranylglycerophospholipid reductase
MTIDIDVAVLGLGPAGARAAQVAAAQGCRVIAFDRKRVAGQPVQCAELVPGLIGQDDAAFGRALAQSVRRMRTTVEHARADLRAPFPGHMIDRARFDRNQVDLAGAAGADCRLATVVTRVDPRTGELVAGGERFRARIVIGADGPRSRLGHALGRRNRVLVHARQLTVPLHTPCDATDIFLSRDIPGGYGWLFPKGAFAHVGIGVAADAHGRLAALLATLHQRLQDDGRVGSAILTQTGGLIPVGGRLPAAATHGTHLSLLAGDAAGLTNPVTGAGIHAALVSGELAGSAAAAWLGGRTAAGVDYDDELEALFGGALARAGRRRRELLHVAHERAPTPDELRAAWIAYPAYWSALPVAPEHDNETTA